MSQRPPTPAAAAPGAGRAAAQRACVQLHHHRATAPALRLRRLLQPTACYISRNEHETPQGTERRRMKREKGVRGVQVQHFGRRNTHQRGERLGGRDDQIQVRHGCRAKVVTSGAHSGTKHLPCNGWVYFGLQQRTKQSINQIGLANRSRRGRICLQTWLDGTCSAAAAAAAAAATDCCRFVIRCD
jgi:hypothetical protein